MDGQQRQANRLIVLRQTFMQSRKVHLKVGSNVGDNVEKLKCHLCNILLIKG